MRSQGLGIMADTIILVEDLDFIVVIKSVVITHDLVNSTRTVINIIGSD